MTKTALGCVIVTVLFAAANAALMARAFEARGNRLEQVDSRLAKISDLEQRLVQEQAAVDSLEAQVLATDLQWGTVWPQTGQTNVVDPGQGLIEFGIGAANGLGNAAGGPAPTVHTFGVNPDNTGQYLGEFRITAAAPNAATGKLTRPPLPGETNDWQQAAVYRARTAVPSAYTNTIDELVAAANIAQQDLQEEQRRLERARQQLADSQAVLAERQAELAGDADAPEGAAASAASGLVKSIEETTAARDAKLARVDQLRRRYRAKSRELNALLGELRSLRDGLPTAG